MNRIGSRTKRILATIALIIAILLPPQVLFAKERGDDKGHHDDKSAKVVLVNEKVQGKSYSEWSVAWWQWAASIPVSANPLLDETGVNCASGQSGKVWFLAGKFVFNPVNSATRRCTIPEGKFIFFPVINGENDNQTCLDPDTTYTVDELRAALAAVQNAATDLAVDVDGVAVSNVPSYRIQSPVFTLTMPDNNFYQAVGCAEGAGAYGPAVSDGYWIMLAPLSEGEHTIHFHSAVFGNALDMTYLVRVGKEKR